jgi:hypothetical protein
MPEPQTSFVVDRKTLAAIEELQTKFGAADSAEVIRKALGLAKLAAENADDNNSVTILTRAGTQKRINLAG